MYEFGKCQWELASRTISGSHDRCRSTVGKILVSKFDHHDFTDDRPHCDISIFEKDFNCLLDSGANFCIAGAKGIEVLKALALKIDRNFGFVCIKTADSTKHKIAGIFYVPMVFNGIEKLIEVLAIPSLSQTIVLGVNFWEKFELSVSCSRYGWSVISEPECLDLDLFFEQIFLHRDDGCLVDRDSLTLAQEQLLSDVIAKFRRLSPSDEIGEAVGYVHEIDTGDAKPIKQVVYPVSPIIARRMGVELDRFLKLGVVEPSNSPWCSNVALSVKPNGTDRMCLDSRKLNGVSKKDSYPLPRIDSILARLGKTRFLSSVDLKDFFLQIRLSEASKEKTAFCVPGRGLFQFKRLPFGLHNSAQAAQRLMDSIFGHSETQGNRIFVYLDDLILISETFEEHVELMELVLNKLETAGLTINFDKCKFCRSELKYLGYIVDGDGLRTDPDKVEKIVNFPKPKSFTEMKRFIGLASWYRRFVRDFASVSAPLHELLKGIKKGGRLRWSEEADASFVALKDCLVSAPVLATPDFSKKFSIHCDASKYGVGVVLTQGEGVEEHPIAFDGRKFRGAELNYSVTEQECLSVVFGIQKFRPFIEGYEFDIITDHHSLIWLLHQPNPAGRLARWVLQMQQFNFKIFHRKGALNVVPDALSRIYPIVDLITFTVTPADKWYIDMKEKVLSSPYRFRNWKIDNGLLFIKLDRKEDDLLPDTWKLIVPESARDEVLQECHDEPISGHVGITKTKHKVLQRYFWPGVSKCVTNYVKKCDICKQCKSKNSLKHGKMGTYKIAQRPWQMVSLDLMGPFPRSKLQNTSLLVICDWFTKYPILIPLRKATAKKVLEVVERQVFQVFNVPEIVISDNGTQFTADEFKKFILKYGIEKLWFNAFYHPQNNPTERVNKSIGNMLRAYIGDNHRDWDKHLGEIAVALRTSVHEATGYTPFFLNFGREYCFHPSDHNLYDDTSVGPVEAVEKRSLFLTRFKEVFDDVSLRIRRCYDKNKRYYDRKREGISFNVGDRVFKRTFYKSDKSKQFMAKLAFKFVPCRVKAKVSDVMYELEDFDDKSLGRWHVKDIFK